MACNKACSVPLTEAQIEAQIVEYLSAVASYTVLKTTNSKAKGPTGASRGVPDLLVRGPKYPSGVWVGLEVKGPKTQLSPEQARLADASAIHVVRSLEAACLAIVLSEDEIFVNGSYVSGLLWFLEGRDWLLRGRIVELLCEESGQEEKR